MPNAETGFHHLHDLLGHHKKLALAVSGGSDSTALMVLVAHWAKQNNRLDDFSILSVDHSLRENSHKEANQVCAWAKALGLACQVLVWRHGEQLTGDKQLTGLQEKARAGRYRLMGQWCADNEIDGIITAHNRDDQAETMLMRLARGSGVDGLAAMKERSELFGAVVYRPLLAVSRQTLQDVLRTAGHGWIDDPSNYNEKFERVRVRGAMAAVKKAGIDVGNLNLSARRLMRASAALEHMSDDFMAKAVTVFNTGHCEVDRSAFEALPDEIALRVLARLLEWAGGGDEPVRMAKIERLYGAIKNAGQKTGAKKYTEKYTLAGARIALRKSCLVIGREFGRIETTIQADDQTGLQTSLQNGAMVWDNRFVFKKPHFAQPGWVQPYGLFIEDDDRQRPAQIPFFVACALPAFIEGASADEKVRKIIVPHLDFADAGSVQLRSLPRGVMSAVAFAG